MLRGVRDWVRRVLRGVHHELGGLRADARVPLELVRGNAVVPGALRECGGARGAGLRVAREEGGEVGDEGGGERGGARGVVRAPEVVDVLWRVLGVRCGWGREADGRGGRRCR